VGKSKSDAHPRRRVGSPSFRLRRDPDRSQGQIHLTLTSQSLEGQRCPDGFASTCIVLSNEKRLLPAWAEEVRVHNRRRHPGSTTNPGRGPEPVPAPRLSLVRMTAAHTSPRTAGLHAATGRVSAERDIMTRTGIRNADYPSQAQAEVP